MNAVKDLAKAAGLGDLVDAAQGCCSAIGGGCCSAGVLAQLADMMDVCAEFAEYGGRLVGCLASPCAFPIVYLFPAEGDNGGTPWDVSMEEAPFRQPLVCCSALCCNCCTQYYVRQRVLNGDLSQYKCFQGRRDGPYCCATCIPGAPFTFQAGSYGEQDCPQLCLCAEATLCTFCAFHVSRDVQRAERGLGLDPTELRVYRCLDFFGQLSHCLCCCGCCLKCTGCCMECCLGSGDGGEFNDSAQRLGNSLIHIAHGIRRGMHWVIVIAMGCMSAQMVHESNLPNAGGGLPKGVAVPPQVVGMPPPGVQPPPGQERMGLSPGRW